MPESRKPLIHIGWIVADRNDDAIEAETREAAERLRSHLEEQLPGFEWRTDVAARHFPRERLEVDPLELLEIGVQEKVERRWDFALVVTGWELKARKRPYTVGVPSSALETAVLSSARFTSGEKSKLFIAILGQYLLGSLLGLEPSESGAMRRPEELSDIALQRFSETELETLRDRLDEVGDERLEERRRSWNRLGFHLQAFFVDPKGIVTDLLGYRPWSQPFRLGRLTAAAFVSMLLMFMGAEVWELGIGSQPVLLIIGAAIAIGSGTLFLYRGQNLSELTRRAVLSEQLARSRIVLLLCLLFGMTTLWLLLFGVSFGLASALPRGVIEGWLDQSLDAAARARFSAFTSTLGTLAGALGGNLEEEDNFKSEFFFDEEA